MRACCAALLLGLASVAPLAAAEEAPAVPPLARPADFAYGMAVEPDALEVPLVALTLPLELYRGAQSEELLDLAVFNAEGVALPHAIRTLGATSGELRPSVELPLYPIAAGVPDRPDALDLDVQRSPDGQVIQIKTREPRPEDAAAPPPVASYVVDARALEGPLAGLQIRIESPREDLVLSVKVEASEDLVQFSPLAAEGALVQLRYAGERVERDRIAIHTLATGGKGPSFLRLRVAQPLWPVRVVQVRGESVPGERPPDLQRVEVVGREIGGADAIAYRFDLGGPVPVDRIELLLPEDNMVLAAELLSAASEKGPYRALAKDSFYRIALEGETLQSPPLEISRRRDRYYELRVDRKSGAPGRGAPRLVALHAPEQLLFVRRGEGPFTLAYGRYRPIGGRFGASELLAVLPSRASGEPPIAAARLGPPSVLGGEAVLQPPPEPLPPFPWKKFVLWAVLVASVALLGRLALRLIRETAAR